MRVFYPIKAAQLLLTVVCLALILNSKLLCVYKDPLDGLNEQQVDCHATLIQKVFAPLTKRPELVEEASVNGAEETSGLKEKITLNGTELVGEKTNTTDMMDKAMETLGTLIQKILSLTNGTAVNGTSLSGSAEETSEELLTNETSLNETELLEIKFHLRACLLIDGRDVYDPKSQLTPLFSLRVFCLLILELFLLVLQMALVMTSYEVPDQLTIMLNNLTHGLCWLITAVVLFLQRCGWQKEWISLTPDFVPVYPAEYEWAQLIAWSSLVFLLVEALLFHNCVYYDLTMEKMEEQLAQPTVIVTAYKDSDQLLPHHDHN